MIRTIPAADRHFADMGWLKTRWLFSFSHYFDPENVQFGNLRVFNDDRVAPHTGFKMHDHAEMEIVTIMLAGRLTHQDSTGEPMTIGPHEVQRMTAGTGIRHSEMNHGDQEVHLYQIWFFPRESHLDPGYEQKRFPEKIFNNSLVPLVSGAPGDDVISMQADATVYRGRYAPGESFTYRPNKGRGVFLYITTGILNTGDQSFEAGDQARIAGEMNLELKAEEDADFILIDVSLER
ncbi:MAG: pirin family protein [Calditrichota bacterium]